MKLAGFFKKTAGAGQKKAVLSWTLRYGAVLGVFLFIFIPLQIRLSGSMLELNSLKKEMEGTKKMMGNLLTPAEVKKMRADLDNFESRITDASMAGKILDEVSRMAEAHHMKMVEINSDPPSHILDDTGKPLELAGKKLSVFPVSFRVETGYKDLAGFLKSLSEGSKWDMTVESLKLQRSSAETENLQCDVLLSYITQ